MQAVAALERLKFGVTTSLSMTGSSPRVDSVDAAMHAPMDTSSWDCAMSSRQDRPLPHGQSDTPPAGGSPVPLEITLHQALDTTEEIVQALDGTHSRCARRCSDHRPSSHTSSDESLASATSNRLFDVGWLAAAQGAVTRTPTAA